MNCCIQRKASKHDPTFDHLYSTTQVDIEVPLTCPLYPGGCGVPESCLLLLKLFWAARRACD
jgi:hypothetical protein